MAGLGNTFSGKKAAQGALENGGIPGAIAALVVWGLGQAGADVPGEIAVAIAALVTGAYRFAKAAWKYWEIF